MAITAWGLALIYPTGTWPEGWPRPVDNPQPFKLRIVALIALGLGAVFLTAAGVNARRWYIAGAVRRLSNDPRHGGRPTKQLMSPPRGPLGPPGELIIHRRSPRGLPRAPKPQRITAQHNVVGRPPRMIIYLRLFENFSRARTFARGAWREFGYVHLLRSTDSVTPSEYRALKTALRRGADPSSVFVSSALRLEATLNQTGYVPERAGRRALRSIAHRTIRVRDPYGAYSVRDVLCHGSFWRDAVDQLLDISDLVVIDLSGLLNVNSGTRYELQRVLDRVPIRNILFLCDARSNFGFLQQHIGTAWSRLASDSPNRMAATQSVTVWVTDYFVETRTTDSHGNTVSSRTRLVARRSETRRLLAWISRVAEPRITPSHGGISLAAVPCRPQRRVAVPILFVGTAAALIALIIAVTLQPHPFESASQEQAPSALRLTVEHVDADSNAESSHDDAENATTFVPENLIDGRTDTAWRTDGDASGQTITIDLGKPYHVLSVGLIPGYDKVDATSGVDRFIQNRRVVAVTWESDAHQTADQQFKDARQMQSIPVDFVTQYLYLKIRQTTPISSRDFTAISEIQISGLLQN